MYVSEQDFQKVKLEVVESLNGIDSLFLKQEEVLKSLVEGDNIFLMSPTNSGKSLPPLILPLVCLKLREIGYNFQEKPRVLFVTALNSIQRSLVTSASALGISSVVITSENIAEVMDADVPVLFVGPEVLKKASVSEVLLNHRTEFICKVIDEAHLGEL